MVLWNNSARIELEIHLFVNRQSFLRQWVFPLMGIKRLLKCNLQILLPQVSTLSSIISQKAIIAGVKKQMLLYACPAERAWGQDRSIAKPMRPGSPIRQV